MQGKLCLLPNVSMGLEVDEVLYIDTFLPIYLCFIRFILPPERNLPPWNPGCEIPIHYIFFFCDSFSAVDIV